MKNISLNEFICIITIIVAVYFHVCNGNLGQTAGPMLLYSTMKDIRITRTINSKIKPVTLIRNLTDGAVLDFNFVSKKMCWTDHGLESIQCGDFDGNEIQNKIEIVTSGGGLLSPDGIACDWFTNKIYWTDSETNRIEVATTTGQHRNVLFWTNVDQPRAIALVPMKGLMFWTDWGEGPKIERAGMNGDPSTRKAIVTDRIFWPNGLTVDYESELIYFIDGKLLFIDVMDYNGQHRSTILKSGFEYPFALTFFQNKLYWTDWKTWSIHVHDINSTQDSKEYFHHSDVVPMDIHVWDQRRQPLQAHPCENNNGGCSHLCLLAPYDPGYSCACPIGIKLIDNVTCANGPQELLILATRTDIYIIYLDSADYTHKILPLTNMKYTIAVDYDPVDGFIYWTDDEVKKIQKVRLNGSEQTDVIITEVQHPDGVAIDWIARNLYWTDTGTDRIEVARLDGKYRKVIISEGLLEPRAITVAPEIGWMFWSDWNEKSPKIERSNLDGSEREVIISSNLGWPNGVTLDLENSKIYWCDAKTDKIEYSNMDGTDRRELLNDNLPHVFGFSLMGDYLYWTDWQRRAIDRVHKESGGSREVIVDQIANVMGLKAIRLGETRGTNPCGIDNGECSHFCLYRHNRTYICTCQIGYELTKDGHKCVIPEAFLLYTRKDSIGRVSIENGGNEMTIPITGVKHASSVDFDITNSRIYWSDSKLRVIMRAFINGSDPQRVVELGLASPEGIAVDWIAQNIYWADSATHRIEVSRLDGSSRRTLIWRDIDEPHNIALFPQEGYMYWSEWGHSNSIKRASMGGTNPVSLINTRHATGLTLHHQKKRLYWTETTIPSIFSSDLNGMDKQILVKENLRKPIALTLFKDTLYWSDEITGDISEVDTTNPLNRRKIYQLSESATDLLVYHFSRQEGFNQCGVNNGGCSHLCLSQPAQNQEEFVSFTCACPTHYIIYNNTCIPPKRFMIYSQRNLAVRLLPDTLDSPEAVLPIQGLKGVKAIDFDPVHHFLYWIEGKTHSIKRASDTGLHMMVIVPGNQGHHPYDIAIDALGRLLFWSCASQDVVNVTRLDNSSTVGVVIQRKGEKPRLIAIHPTKRLLFYTDVGMTPQLVRTRMDGTQRIVITNKGNDIAAIAVDAENDLIVWAQGHSIYMCNIDGENQHVVFNESNSRVTQLAIHSGWLYWLDREIQQLQRLELKTGSSRSVVLTHASLILDLVSVKQPDLNHSCSQLRPKRCSHLCVINGTIPVCSCPHGLALQDDKRTCSAVPDCGNDHFTCSAQAPSNKDCIPVSWRCDGQNDCPDGSDEMGCPTCQSDQFKCQNGLCIEQMQVCDGIPQCSDRFDEAHCCKSHDEYRCPLTDVCIPVSLLCDGMDNCADGADERASVCSYPKKHISITKDDSNALLITIVCVALVVALLCIIIFLIRKRIQNSEVILRDQSEDPLNPMQVHLPLKVQNIIHKGIPDVVRSSSYNRDNITGASSSTNDSSLIGYPCETLNPPPSPATTAASTRNSSPSARYRPYRHYKLINQPPPPTPCSTDVCDESDYNYSTRSHYDCGSIPPPPTPRSHCHSESCPPSPSSRSSTYFNPLPPPPSPVPSPTY